MRGITQTPLPSVLAMALVALLGIPVVAASSGLPPTISIEAGSADTDAGIEVTGLDFPAGASVELEVGTSAGPIALGTAATDESGFFRQSVTLPDDLAPGTWELRAIASDGSIAAGTFRVGPATQDTVAVETSAQGAVVAEQGNSGSDILVMIIIAFLIAGVVGGAMLAWHLVREDSFQPGMSVGEDPIWSGRGITEPEVARMNEHEARSKQEPVAAAGDDRGMSAAHSD